MPRLNTSPGTLSAFRSLPGVMAVIGLGALAAACSSDPTVASRDVGSMAYPQPLPQGNLSTTTVAGRQPRDTGNMAYPAAVPTGVVGRFDAGSTVDPTPRHAGDGPVSAVK